MLIVQDEGEKINLKLVIPSETLFPSSFLNYVRGKRSCLSWCNFFQHNCKHKCVRWWRMWRCGSIYRTSGVMLIRTVFSFTWNQLTRTTWAQGCIWTVRVQRALNRHTSPLRLTSYSIGGELSGVDTCWVCLQPRFLLNALWQEEVVRMLAGYQWINFNKLVVILLFYIENSLEIIMLNYTVTRNVTKIFCMCNIMGLQFPNSIKIAL